LEEWKEKYGGQDKSDPDDTYTFSGLQNRIEDVVGKEHPLRDGLNDLGLNNWGQPPKGNLLMPVDTPKLSEKTPLYIIDQPGANRLGILAARKAGKDLHDLATKVNKIRPYIRHYVAKRNGPGAY